MNTNKITKKAFTFVELIVVVVILSILGTIGFISYSGQIANGRDTQRKAHISELFSSLKTYKQKKGTFPIPSNYFKISTGTIILFWQGKMTKDISLSTIDEIPFDPKLNIPYLYSITPNRQEFELAASLENEDGNKALALTKGNYKSVSKNILPVIMIATGADINISNTNNKNLFIFNNQSHNLPYNFEGNLEPISDGTDFNILLQEAIDNGNFYQNSSFETCLEIKNAGKSIGDGEYQIRTITGALTNTGCVGM